jgi:hypothetical protein
MLPSCAPPSQRNSTPQHYDTIEIIALGGENCVCMYGPLSNCRGVSRGVANVIRFTFTELKGPQRVEANGRSPQTDASAPSTSCSLDERALGLKIFRAALSGVKVRDH